MEVMKLCSAFYRQCGIVSFQHAIKATPMMQKISRYSSDTPSWIPPPSTEEELAAETAKLSTSVRQPSSIPIITSREMSDASSSQKPRQCWVVDLNTIEERKLGLVDLHPDVFAVYPRIDVLHQNVLWQRLYKHVDYTTVKTRAELPGGNRKPWRQKGTGRARHGSIRSPLFIGGGKAHGPRGPKSYYYMLDFYSRVKGLTTALSVKHSQNYLHIVDSLEMPTDDPDYLLQLQDNRNWGLSVLFIDDLDVMPRNISLATDKIKHFNLMPVYGLNVYSMLKHESLVLTLAAVEKIEAKLLYHLKRRDGLQAMWAVNNSPY